MHRTIAYLNRLVLNKEEEEATQMQRILHVSCLSAQLH
jgi:hypothetical protein